MRGWGFKVLKPLLATLVIGGALLFLQSLRHGVALDILLILAAGAALTLLTWTGVELREATRQAVWFTHRDDEYVAPMQIDQRLLRLRRDLRDTVDRGDRTDAVRPLLADLAQDRLQADHGIGLDDPAAVTLLTEPVHRYLTTDRGDTARRSKKTLHTVIDRIEAL